MILQAPMAISILRGPNYDSEIANKIALALWDKTDEDVFNKSIFDVIPHLEKKSQRNLGQGHSHRKSFFNH